MVPETLALALCLSEKTPIQSQANRDARLFDLNLSLETANSTVVKGDEKSCLLRFVTFLIAAKTAC